MKKKVFSFLLAVMMLVTMLPMTVFAANEQMSDEFKSYLNEKGELVINAIKPSTEEERDFYMLEYMLMMTDYNIEVLSDTYDESTSTCDVKYWGETEETHNVKIVFNYDEDVYAATKELVKTLPDEKTVFMVSDMEIVNYWMSRTGEDSDEIGGGLDNFSTQLKDALGNKNYSFFVDQRAGADCIFMTERLGIAMLMHDGVAYYYDEALGTRAEHVIYIPEDTADTKEAIMAAVQKRMDSYLGVGKLTVNYGGQGALDCINAECDERIAEIDALLEEKEAIYMEYEKQLAQYDERIAEVQKLIDAGLVREAELVTILDDVNISDADRAEASEELSQIYIQRNALYAEQESINMERQSDQIYHEQQQFYLFQIEPLVNQRGYVEEEKAYYKEEYENEDGAFYFLQSAAGDYWFTVTINDEVYSFVAMKDDDKMLTPTYASADIKTNVTVSSTDSSIPLDTKVDVDKLTSGTLYDKIMKLLNVDENETFDISLYSGAKGGNITKLENGTFEVKIPVSDALKGKDLLAYYVDEDNNVVEYKVTVKDGYATFATNHFSIYTIAEAIPEKVEVVAPETNVGGSTFEEKAEVVVEKVPFTPEEKELIEAGAEVTITLEVKDITETVSKEDKAKVEAEVKEVKDQKVGMYLDVNMFKQVGDKEAVKVPELNGKVKIQLTVPDTLLVKDTTMNRVYSIIRIHEGETTVLDAKFDATTKTLVFETDSFSTYALVYKDVAKVPQTGDSTSVAVWMMLLAVGGCAILLSKKAKMN